MLGTRGCLDLVALGVHDALFVQAFERHGDCCGVYVV